MPIVKGKMWEGRDAVTKRKIMKGTTDVLPSLEIPSSAVTGIITGYPKEIGGKEEKLQHKELSERAN